jgi:hypothetical protein
LPFYQIYAAYLNQLASTILDEFGTAGQLCMLFPSARPAGECKSYLVRHVDFPEVTHTDFTVNKFELDGLELHVIFFPSQAWKVAKSFWQHAGMGVSSRYAEAYLSRVQNVDLPKTIIDNSVRDPNFFGVYNILLSRLPRMISERLPRRNLDYESRRWLLTGAALSRKIF